MLRCFHLSQGSERMVRLGKTACFLVLAATISAGCASTSSSTTSSSGAAAANATGETTSKRAVEAFMRAVKAQDLQAMASSWGNTRGPARDQMDRETLEKRLIVIQCLLMHDSWSFVEDGPRWQTGGRHQYRIQVRGKGSKAQTSITYVRGPPERVERRNCPTPNP